MDNKGLIGVVGGIGPYAGIDLVEKVFKNTKSKRDQDHIPIVLLSLPEQIVDRTSFLLGQTNTNPAHSILGVIKKLELIGATVIGIPCNTAHSPKIFNILVEELKKSQSDIKILHMIKEVAAYINQNHPKIKKVGLLSTLGTYKTEIYSNILEPEITVITPTEKMKELVHDTIYNPDYGIKAQSKPVTNIAKTNLLQVISYLEKQGAEAIILGCTELPLAIDNNNNNNNNNSNLILIDSTSILARSLIKHTYPTKLKNEFV